MKVRAQFAITALIGVLGLAACSQGGGGSTDAAGGWTRVTVGQLSLERPSDWTEEAATGDRWTKRFVGEGLELQIAGELSEDPTASAALSRLDLPAMTSLDSYDGGGARRIDVEGADTAIRSDFTFKDGGTSKKGVWLIAGQYPYPRTAAVALTGATLDEATVAHIIDSMTYEKKNS